MANATSASRQVVEPDTVRPQELTDDGMPRTPLRAYLRHRVGVGTVLAAAAVVATAWIVAATAPMTRADGGMSASAAILLGVIEGLTEWLPISSTGHLTVAQGLLGLGGGAAHSYAIAIQSGAILAVLGLYRGRFRAMARGALGRDLTGRHVLICVATACVPAVVLGLAFDDVIKQHLFGTWPVVVAWFAGGIVILWFAWRRRHVAPMAGARLTDLTWRGALLVGLAQSVALWPGVSRSLVTIVAATAVGLSVPAAVEFSFLLGFVILGGATLYESLSGGGDLIAAYGVATPLLGVGVAFVSAMAAMRWMVAYLNRRGLAVFGWYRVFLAAAVAVLLVTGAVEVQAY